MTIIYDDGTAVEALLLSSEVDVMKLVIAGDDKVRHFRCTDGSWRAENGQHVEVDYSSQTDRREPLPEESQFTCSIKVVRQIFSNLMNGSQLPDSAVNPFYVFSAQKGRLRVTVLHSK